MAINKIFGVFLLSSSLAQAGGVINPRTGDYYPNINNGSVNPSNGQYYPRTDSNESEQVDDSENEINSDNNEAQEE